MGNYGGGNSAVQGGVYALAGFTEALRKHQEFKMKHQKYLDGKAMAEEQQELEQSRFKLQEDSQREQRAHRTAVLKLQQDEANQRHLEYERNRKEREERYNEQDRRYEEGQENLELDREMKWVEQNINAPIRRKKELEGQLQLQRTYEKQTEQDDARKDLLKSSLSTYDMTLREFYEGRDFDSVRDPEFRAEAMEAAKAAALEKYQMGVEGHNALYDTKLDSSALTKMLGKKKISEKEWKGLELDSIINELNETDRIFTEDELDTLRRMSSELKDPELEKALKDYDLEMAGFEAVEIVKATLSDPKGARITKKEAEGLEALSKTNDEAGQWFLHWDAQDEHLKWATEEEVSNVPRKGTVGYEAYVGEKERERLRKLYTSKRYRIRQAYDTKAVR